MGERFENKTVYTRPMLLKAYRELYGVHKKSWVIWAISDSVVFAAAAVLFFFFVPGAPDVAEAMWFCFLALIWPLAYFIPNLRAALKYRWYTGKRPALEQTYTFGDKGFTVSNARGTFTYDWLQCSRRSELNGLCLLKAEWKIFVIDMDGFVKDTPQEFLHYIRPLTLGVVPREERKRKKGEPYARQ